jgi:3-isopropylmalate/(R)-2-methylmalate dehydratase small subunit
MILRGRVWKLGDNIASTDVVPSRYDAAAMRANWDECAKHLFEDVQPNFVRSVQKGDLIVAGANFGRGHAHYHRAAVMGCRVAGVGALFAHSIDGLFFRAATDLGLVSWWIAGLETIVETGNQLELDLGAGSANNLTTGQSLGFAALPEVLLSIFRAGGSEPWALAQVTKLTASA